MAGEHTHMADPVLDNLPSPSSHNVTITPTEAAAWCRALDWMAGVAAMRTDLPVPVAIRDLYSRLEPLAQGHVGWWLEGRRRAAGLGRGEAAALALRLDPNTTLTLDRLREIEDMADDTAITETERAAFPVLYA